MEDFSQETSMQLIKQHGIPIVLGVVGIVFLGYGIVQLWPQKPAKPDVLFESATNSSSAKKRDARKTKEITVDIAGAIQKPGVYKLKADSRIQDALIAAGGLSAKADREQLAKDLNLAAKLTDGAKVYIPFVGEQASVGGSSTQGVTGGSTMNNHVNINTATSQELEDLPGIGEVTAGKIIAARPYASLEELVTKKAVGKSVFEKIKGQVSVN